MADDSFLLALLMVDSIDNLEEELDDAKRKNHNLKAQLNSQKTCTSCIELRREKAEHCRKCKMYDRKISELTRRLAEAEKEIRRLNDLIASSDSVETGTMGPKTEMDDYQEPCPQMLCEPQVKTEQEYYNEDEDTDCEEDGKVLGDMYSFLNQSADTSCPPKKPKLEPTVGQ